MTPKSLLRHPEAKSKFSNFDEGTHFLRLIPDSTAREGEGVKRIAFCSGKVYYELAKQRELAGLQESVAVSRVEQVHIIITSRRMQGIFGEWGGGEGES